MRACVCAPTIPLRIEIERGAATVNSPPLTLLPNHLLKRFEGRATAIEWDVQRAIVESRVGTRQAYTAVPCRFCLLSLPWPHLSAHGFSRTQPGRIGTTALIPRWQAAPPQPQPLCPLHHHRLRRLSWSPLLLRPIVPAAPRRPKLRSR